MVHAFWTDLRYAARLFLRSPAFVVVTAMTMALGVGATTAIFSVMDAVLVRPLPYADPDRLVIIRADTPAARDVPALSGPEVQDLRAARSFAGVASLVAVGGNLTTPGDMEKVPTANATDDFLRVLGVAPILGRALDARTDSGPRFVRAVLISYELWQRHFGGDPHILDRTIDVNNLRVTVAGVLPPGLRIYLGRDTSVPARVDIWFPRTFEGDRADRYDTTIARLAPGVTVAQAQAELDAISARIASAHAREYAGGVPRLFARPLQVDVARESRPMLLALMGAVCFVLLIACANIANLLLSRTAARAREVSVRAALGATRGRLARMFVAEGLLLGAAGGAIGWLVAVWAQALILWLRPASLPPIEIGGLDGRAIAFLFLVTLTSSVLMSVAPAWQSVRRDPGDALKDGGRGDTGRRSRLRTALVVTEVALAAVLLAGAGLMIRTMIELNRVALGFEPRGVLTLHAPANPFAIREYPRKVQFFRGAMDAVRGLPGVRSVAAILPLPLEDRRFVGRIATDVRPDAPILTEQFTAMPGAFAAIGISLHAGRDFTDSDIDAQRSVAIVDDLLARTAWPGESAIGRRLRLVTTSRTKEWAEVVGVVSHVRAASLRDEGRLQVYLAYPMFAASELAIIIRADGNPASLMAAAARAVEAVPDARPTYDVKPMTENVREAAGEQRFALVLLGSFAAVALLLAAVGLYGVISYSTSQRTREIGIRVALGADPASLVRMVLREGLMAAALGLAAGAAAALAMTPYLRSVIYGVGPRDPVTLFAVGMLLLAIAAAASWVPARRAAHVDPSVALRE